MKQFEFIWIKCTIELLITKVIKCDFNYLLNGC